jgi:hypothetical protein
MTAKEKAEELIEKYISIMPCLLNQTVTLINSHAINCAIILVDELLKSDLRKSPYAYMEPEEFWNRVREYLINKLKQL